MQRINVGQVEKFSSYKEKVYAQLKELILNGTLEPGAILQERELAGELGVSRTPVREAIKLLEHEGWVVTVPWKGVFVRQFSDKEIMDIIELRIAIESYVVRQIADSVPFSVIDNLAQEVEKSKVYAEKGEYLKTVEIDKNFHFTLAEQLKNERISNMLQTLSDQILFLGMKALLAENRPVVNYQEHSLILRALQDRNAEEAVRVVESHLLNTLAAIQHGMNGNHE